MSKASKSTSKILSTWTPLNNEETNRKVFEERRELVCKWYNKWSDGQRKKIINDILKMSKTPQLEFMESIAKTKIPIHNADFTRMYPRVITLYIFSYLDPRTLCRCAQVCWFWKYLSELDQLWMMKSLRLGWNLSFSPGPFEQGIWKRNYIENIKSLQYLKPETTLPVGEFQDFDIESINATSRSRKSNKTETRLGMHEKRKQSMKPSSGKPSWKGSDPEPKDTWRYNYLNNDDDVEIIKAMRQHGLSGPKSSQIVSKAKSRVKTGRHFLNTRSKSMTLSPPPSSRTSYSRCSGVTQGLSGVESQIREQTMEEKLYGGRPNWAQPHTLQNTNISAPFTVKQTTENCPPRTVLRTDRDPPVSGSAFEEFTRRPWTIPDQTDSD